MCEAVFGESIIKRAQEKGIVDIAVHNLRDWTYDSHRSVDDKPFGGGPGMVMKPEPIFEAVEEIRKKKTAVILLSPQGEKLNQETRPWEEKKREIGTRPARLRMFR